MTQRVDVVELPSPYPGLAVTAWLSTRWDVIVRVESLLWQTVQEAEPWSFTLVRAPQQSTVQQAIPCWTSTEQKDAIIDEMCQAVLREIRWGVTFPVWVSGSVENGADYRVQTLLQMNEEWQVQHAYAVQVPKLDGVPGCGVTHTIAMVYQKEATHGDRT